MKSYLADLDLVSSTLSLAEVSALVGHTAGSASHDLSEPRTASLTSGCARHGLA